MVAKYGHNKFDFWTEALPQAAHQYDCLKHVLVATALLDELVTSPITIPKIERSITYHYQQALTKTAYSKPSIERVLLTCMMMFYFESLRGDMNAIYVHLESARKILDEYKAKGAKSPPSTHDLICAIDAIVDECRIYATSLPPPPLIIEASPSVHTDWEALPTATPYDSHENAEYALVACFTNLCRPTGQFPLALVRANAFLDQWLVDCRGLQSDTKESVRLAMCMQALFNIAKNVISLLDQGSPKSLDERWQKLMQSVQDMPNLRSSRFRKPIAAVTNVLQRTSQTPDQRAAIADLQKHLQRSVLYIE